MAAPIALLVSRLRPRWLAAGFAVQMAISLSLATVNYLHWDGYRRFAESITRHTADRRVWINDEWGLRFYLASQGGLPLRNGQPLRPGDLVVTSELSRPVQFNDPVRYLVALLDPGREIDPERDVIAVPPRTQE